MGGHTAAPAAGFFSYFIVYWVRVKVRIKMRVRVRGVVSIWDQG